MNNDYQKKWRQLDIYLTHIHQGIILVGNDSQMHHEFIKDYRTHFALNIEEWRI